MRTYTFVASIVAHVTVACALVFSTVLATDDLPEPYRASVFVEVLAVPPPPPPPTIRRPAMTAARVAAIPVDAPTGVHPEPEQPARREAFDIAPDDVFVGISADPSTAVHDELPPPPARAVSGPLRVGGTIRPPEKIVHVSPKYPSIARSAGIGGVVVLEAMIGEDGTVRDIRILRSPPLLDDAAAEAVRHWRFTPTLLNGQPVSVLMTVTVTFALE